MAHEAPRLRRGVALRSSHYAGGVTSRECADPRASRTDGYRDSVQKPNQRDQSLAHYSGADGIVPGSRGSVSYVDRLPGGKYEKLFSLYILDWSAPGVAVQSVPAWSTPWVYRCDNGVASSGEGCVTNYTPTLGLSVRNAGASAALFRWAQVHMETHWGLKGKGKPLTRASNSTAAENRKTVCDSTFRNKGTVIVHGRENDKDSCDEFPFAATNQSGASQLKAKKEKGTVCAQLQSVRTAKSGTEAEQWGNVSVIGTPNYSVPCVRGHVPLKLNNSTGGSYRAFIQSQRLFVDDAFWVSVGT